MSALFAALMVLDGILAWALALHRDRFWVPKLLALAAAIAVNVAAVGAFSSGDGWPVSGPPPAQSEVVGCQVAMPDPAAHLAGAIYVWAVPLPPAPLVGYRATPGSPRAYRLPYSDQLAAGCLRVRQSRAAYGVRQGGGQAVSSTVKEPGRYHFYRLPPPGVPAKVRLHSATQ